ncbi:hypothetical protein BU15DRAFT_75096 [Melanogaster broomeanus]|nr:hypothetical protein BU15DRAFT_75096 [Melanogaster broomeanus]
MPASFISTPPELLEEIVLAAIRDTPRGPPVLLHSLLLTCRMSRDALSSENPHFYLMLFLDKFDISSPRRHLSQNRLTLQNMEQEVKRRYTALQIIRRRDLWHPEMAEAFATIYIMLLEDDGRNWEQMLWADLPTFMQTFLRERLLEGAADNHGWPLESELNTLAIALFWLMHSQDRLNQETEDCRREIMDLLSPFAFAGFRYPCFTASEHLFFPSESASKAAVSRHGNYPPERPTDITLHYFGEPITFCPPPIAPFAILSYFARMEKFPLKVPLELPANRQDALAMALMIDPIHFSKVAGMLLIGAVRYLDPIMGYYPHILDATSPAPFQEDYQAMLSSPEAPSPFPTFGRFPLYVRFREFYCYSPLPPIPVIDEENSFFNAFLPVGCQWHENESGIEFIGKNASFKAYYTPSHANHEFKTWATQMTPRALERWM